MNGMDKIHEHFRDYDFNKTTDSSEARTYSLEESIETTTDLQNKLNDWKKHISKQQDPISLDTEEKYKIYIKNYLDKITPDSSYSVEIIDNKYKIFIIKKGINEGIIITDNDNNPIYQKLIIKYNDYNGKAEEPNIITSIQHIIILDQEKFKLLQEHLLQKQKENGDESKDHLAQKETKKPTKLYHVRKTPYGKILEKHKEKKRNNSSNNLLRKTERELDFISGHLFTTDTHRLLSPEKITNKNDLNETQLDLLHTLYNKKEQQVNDKQNKENLKFIEETINNKASLKAPLEKEITNLEKIKEASWFSSFFFSKLKFKFFGGETNLAKYTTLLKQIDTISEEYNNKSEEVATSSEKKGNPDRFISPEKGLGRRNSV